MCVTLTTTTDNAHTHTHFYTISSWAKIGMKLPFITWATSQIDKKRWLRQHIFHVPRASERGRSCVCDILEMKKENIHL